MKTRDNTIFMVGPCNDNIVPHFLLVMITSFDNIVVVGPCNDSIIDNIIRFWVMEYFQHHS